MELRLAKRCWDQASSQHDLYKARLPHQQRQRILAVEAFDFASPIFALDLLAQRSHPGIIGSQAKMKPLLNWEAYVQYVMLGQ